jgi:aminoglycoside phosphotransferase (APT) family kinase protein
MKMHDGEVDIDAELVGRLVAAQFPQLTDLPITEVQSAGTVNAIYRLGDHLYARLPRVQTWAPDLDKEWRWLPRLAPHLSLRVPEPVGKGHPASSYPFTWAIYRWIDGQPYADELGGVGVGDPAADVIAAWSVFSHIGRGVFRDALDVDDGTWNRARGFALHQAAMIIPYYGVTNPGFVAPAKRTVEEILVDVNA